MDSVVFTQDWKVGEKYNYGLFSDLHIKPYSPNVEIKKAFDRCREENARIYINGDLADFIIPVDRKRYNKATDNTRTAAPLNEQRDEVIKFLAPYADLIDVVSMGNHEDVLIKYHNYDVLQDVISRLNDIKHEKGLQPIHYGTYQGFTMIQYKYAKGGRRKTLRIYRHHGGGGSAPVTGGAIDLDRVMKDHGADVYHLGHKHQATYREKPFIRVNDNGTIYSTMRKGVMTAGFQPTFEQEDYNKTGGSCSFENRFYGKNPTGWAMMTVRPYNETDGKDMALDYTITMMN